MDIVTMCISLRYVKYPNTPENPTGKIKFCPSKIPAELAISFGYVPMACEQCFQCRLKKSRETAMRATHEASLYEENCFLTLTYDKKHLKSDSLIHEDFSLFMKRFRRRCAGITPVYDFKKEINTYPIRALMCGEYGEKNSRPHFHACIFNFNFDDAYPWQKGKFGHVYKRSPLLEKIWKKGYAVIGDFSYKSAAYVSRYTTKKKFGNEGKRYYGDRKPPYAQYPSGSFLGKGWLSSYLYDVYPLDKVVFPFAEKSLLLSPPEAYDRYLTSVDPSLAESVKAARISKAKDYSSTITDKELAKKEAIFHNRFKLFDRDLQETLYV